MERKRRVRAIWGLAGAVLAVAAIVVPLLVLAGSGQATLTAETYADVIRFGVQGAGTLQIQIYDLSEKVLWDSGAISSDFVDWDRTDTWGERLASGYYLYRAQAWDASETLILDKTGKVALLPGDNVQLQAAPVASAPNTPSQPSAPEPMGIVAKGHTPGLSTFDQVAIGKTTATYLLELLSSSTTRLNIKSSGTGIAAAGFVAQTNRDNQFYAWGYGSGDTRLLFGTSRAEFGFIGTDGPYNSGLMIGTVTDVPVIFGRKNLETMRIGPGGNLGIGTTNAPARLTVQATTGDLIAAYNSTSRAAGAAVFVVTNNGDVKADGSFYGASLIVGSADVAERINTSEWVEAGDVVEIDPDHTGFFRKSADPYSRRVAGIISTSPGVILGNSTDSETGDWDDNRPVLAIAGRVPVKVTTENGPIQVGDLLVASSAPGVAMRGDPAAAVGCVVGKAMEPLGEGEGTIMAQVVLR
jgi:hypothetical protein